MPFANKEKDMKSMKLALIVAASFVLGVACIAPADESDVDETEALDEFTDELAAPGGKCSCNPAPDSSGRWSVSSQTCSACSESSDCATASCKYKHSVHGGEKEVGCQFASKSAATDVAETAEIE